MRIDTPNQNARLVRGSGLAFDMRVITYVRHLNLVSLLQMISEYFDELESGYVFYGEYVSVDQRQVLLKSRRQHGSLKDLPPYS